MLHKNREEFIKILERAAKNKGFLLPLIEKDYYLTLILSNINNLSKDLIFIGGTCLNKVYYTYYRLSEDLDFSMLLPQYESTRSQRRKCIQPVKENIERFAQQFDMKVANIDNPGRNESKQYVFSLVYRSAIQPIETGIKLEIGLRFNPLDKIQKRLVNHIFLHPFTGEPLLDGGQVNCLSLNELMSEKLRAAASRKIIAPRDFYDIDFALRNNFSLSNKSVMQLFQKKLQENNASPDLNKYKRNLGRTDSEIMDMKSRIETELFDVLTPKEREIFDLDKALSRINQAMNSIKI